MQNTVVTAYGPRTNPDLDVTRIKAGLAADRAVPGKEVRISLRRSSDKLRYFN